ncbi:MAG: RpiB/LacA/LacB family sugar-phosphate isomerase [Phycisphaerales bacterium]|nr:RpiB/LacA/LacB family sugar-phosphate isomerase [Phycisphaerales bacterium]
MKIFVGADHRGVKGALEVVEILRSLRHEVQYIGHLDQTSVDYPEQAYLVALAVASGRADRGVLLTGSGIGTCITCNKIKGIRAVVGYDSWAAEISRAHHDCNVLCIPADLVGPNDLRKIVIKWIETEFEAGRHERRLRKVRLVEEGKDPADYREGD